MKCVPKSHGQALGEVKVTAAFLNNFAGDNVRRLAQSFGVRRHTMHHRSSLFNIKRRASFFLYVFQ